ncbi:flavodoxin [Candidatus Poribacteria bacterium]|nr:flavodoxin [Candidatus Poribacteria bacterium]
MEGKMNTKILVAYATKYGSTKEIAEKIAEVFSQADPDVDLLPVDQVKELDSYDAVVLGSGLYIGRWRKDAAKFLKSNQEILSKKLVWLFSSGPTGEGDPVELMKGWSFPKSLQSVADNINPKDIAVFHGNLDRDKLSTIGKFMIKSVKAPLGDFRDWDNINSWAKGILQVLQDQK